MEDEFEGEERRMVLHETMEQMDDSDLHGELDQLAGKIVAGIASCGCWYHAEQGIPCEHDIALARCR